MAKQPQAKPDTEKPKEERRHQPNKDEVDEASIESFPASDAPGWSGVTASQPKPEDKRTKK